MCLEEKESMEENVGITTENGGHLNSKITYMSGGEKHYYSWFSMRAGSGELLPRLHNVGLLAGNLNRAQFCSRILP